MRIDSGNAQHIGHDGIGGRSSSGTSDTAFPREAHDIPDTEKEGGQPHLLDTESSCASCLLTAGVSGR